MADLTAYQFEPGQSGNPGGLKHFKGFKAAIHRLAGENCETYAKRLHELAMGGKKIPAGVSLNALIFLLERIYGKTPQISLGVSVDAEVKSLSDDQLYERIADLAGNDPRFAGFLAQRGVGTLVPRGEQAVGASAPRKQI